jgi:type I restriction enzyme S subunit
MPTLADCVGGKRQLIGGPFGSKLGQADYVKTGVPVIRGANMEHTNRWIGGDFVYVSEEKVRKDLLSNLARPGDIIVTQRGTLGQVSMVPPGSIIDRFVVSQSQMAISVDVKSADPLFVYYYLKSPKFEAYVESAAIKVGVPHINLGLLRDAPVRWPSRPSQSAIANVLSALDDKIELNLRMNETLEALAQAIFGDWFVDFRPVRRKMEGAIDPVAVLGGLIPDPARAAEISALFPPSLGENGLPKGWELKTVDNMFDLAYGKSLPKTERTEGLYPVYGSGGINGTHHAALVIGPGIVVGRKGTVGSLFWENSDFFPIDTVFYVKPLHGYSLEYLWFVLKSLGLENMNTDAAVPGLNRSNVYRLDVPQAAPNVVAAFTAIAHPVRKKQEANEEENRTLSKTRNYLLPKLMSGDVCVCDAEKAVP